MRWARVRGMHSVQNVWQDADLELCEGVGVIGQAQGVKGTARVQRIGDLASRAAVHAVALSQTQQDHLNSRPTILRADRHI